MLILGIGHTVNGILRSLVLGGIIIPINGYINMVYKTMLAIANTQILSSEAVFRIFNNIQMILAVFMIFRLMISIIQMIISPESGKNQEGNFMGVSKFSIIIKRILLGLILIVLLRPVNIPVSNTGGEGENRLNQYVHNNGIIFGVLYDLQYRILNNHNIECIISDRNCGEVGEIEDENSDENPASSFAAYVVSSFVTPNFDEKVENPDRNNKDDWICHKSTNSDLIDEYNNGMEPSRFLSNEVYKADCDVDDGYFTFDYNYLILLIVLIVVAFILTGFLIDIGIRSIKLTILRLISPIPVISYMSNEKDQILNNWVKNLVSTYVDLFVRLAILFLGFDLISQITSGDTYLSSSELGIFTKVIISVTLLIFLKIAPKYIMDLLGIKSNGMNTLGLSALMGGTARALGGGGAAGFGSGFMTTLDASTDAISQGKAAPGVGAAYRQNADLQAKIRTGDKDAHGGITGRMMDRLDFMNRERNAARYMAGNRDLADAEFVAKEARKQAGIAERDYEIMKATGQDPTGKNRSLQDLYERKQQMDLIAKKQEAKVKNIEDARKVFQVEPRASDSRGRRRGLDFMGYRARVFEEDMEDIGKNYHNGSYRSAQEAKANYDNAPAGQVPPDLTVDDWIADTDTAVSYTQGKINDHDRDVKEYSGTMDGTSIPSINNFPPGP